MAIARRLLLVRPRCILDGHRRGTLAIRGDSRVELQDIDAYVHVSAAFRISIVRNPREGTRLFFHLRSVALPITVQPRRLDSLKCWKAADSSAMSALGLHVDFNFALNALGFIGLIGGTEVVSVMAMIPLYRGRRWLGWYNTPGSLGIARHLSNFASSFQTRLYGKSVSHRLTCLRPGGAEVHRCFFCEGDTVGSLGVSDSRKVQGDGSRNNSGDGRREFGYTTIRHPSRPHPDSHQYRDLRHVSLCFRLVHVFHDYHWDFHERFRQHGDWVRKVDS